MQRQDTVRLHRLAIVDAHEFLDLYQHCTPTRCGPGAPYRWQHAPRASSCGSAASRVHPPTPLGEASSSSTTRRTTPLPWLLTYRSVRPGLTTAARVPRRLATACASPRPGWSPLDLVPHGLRLRRERSMRRSNGAQGGAGGGVSASASACSTTLCATPWPGC